MNKYWKISMKSRNSLTFGKILKSVAAFSSFFFFLSTCGKCAWFWQYSFIHRKIRESKQKRNEKKKKEEERNDDGIRPKLHRQMEQEHSKRIMCHWLYLLEGPGGGGADNMNYCWLFPVQQMAGYLTTMSNWRNNIFNTNIYLGKQLQSWTKWLPTFKGSVTLPLRSLACVKTRLNMLSWQ